MGEIVQFPGTRRPLLTKQQLARELGFSTRWVTMQMRRGMPHFKGPGRTGHVRFDLAEVKEWLRRLA